MKMRSSLKLFDQEAASLGPRVLNAGRVATSALQEVLCNVQGATAGVVTQSGHPHTGTVMFAPPKGSFGRTVFPINPDLSILNARVVGSFVGEIVACLNEHMSGKFSTTVKEACPTSFKALDLDPTSQDTRCNTPFKVVIVPKTAASGSGAALPQGRQPQTQHHIIGLIRCVNRPELPLQVAGSQHKPTQCATPGKGPCLCE